jgi:type I restriction enzyme S subunit
MKNGWTTKTLGDLFDITSSKRVFEADWKTEGVPFYRAREIVKLAKHGFIENELFITEEMFNQYSTKYGAPLEGDIMVTGVGTLGICYVVKKDDRFYFKDGNIIWLQKKTESDSRFVEYAFQSDYLRSQIDDSVGATVGTYTIIKAKNTRIPIPPVPEQQRIVSILDEAFEDIATSKTNAEKNLQNAHAIFESYLQSVFTQKGERWYNKPLMEIAQVFADGDWVESKDQSPTGIRLVQTGNVGKGVFKDRCEKSRYISQETFDRLRCMEIFEGDCLISRLPEPVGRSCLLPNTGEKMITAVDCTIVRFDFKQMIPTFFNYYSMSQDYLQAVESETTGTTRKRISRSKLGCILVPIAPLTDQKRIISSLDKLSMEIQRLESIYQQKIELLEALKKSLLNQAFTREF